MGVREEGRLWVYKISAWHSIRLWKGPPLLEDRKLLTLNSLYHAYHAFRLCSCHPQCPATGLWKTFASCKTEKAWTINHHWLLFPFPWALAPTPPSASWVCSSPNSHQGKPQFLSPLSRCPQGEARCSQQFPSLFHKQSGFPLCVNITFL